MRCTGFRACAAGDSFGGARGCQAALGVFTLIWVVPIGLALAHHALALLLFGMAVVHYAATRDGGERDET